MAVSGLGSTVRVPFGPEALPRMTAPRSAGMRDVRYRSRTGCSVRTLDNTGDRGPTLDWARYVIMVSCQVLPEPERFSALLRNR